jgi:hypothetical protein
MPTTPGDGRAAQPHVRGFEQLGGNLERIVGHLRGLVSALHEFVPAINEAELGREAAERQRRLYEALLDPVDHEQDRLQGLAPLAAYCARATEERARAGRAVEA